MTETPGEHVGTRLLMENERVKIWEMVLDPGEASPLHRHVRDYVLCIVEGESIDADPPDKPSYRTRVKAGQFFYVQRGGAECAVNRSTVRFRELIVELKDPA
jgi:mannose-6-phosphate isomerase-like protein (cupin superfamily)